MEDLNRVERRLAERMPPQNAERFENVMHKLEKVATYVENLDRVVSVKFDLLHLQLVSIMWKSIQITSFLFWSFQMQLIAKDFEDNVYKSDWEWQEILKNMDNEWDQ